VPLSLRKKIPKKTQYKGSEKKVRRRGEKKLMEKTKKEWMAAHL
jgi:hypothetical protein